MNDESEAEIAGAISSVAHAMYPAGIAGGNDAAGGHVASLTEAVMGVTRGLCCIAEALDNVAQAIRES